MCSVPIISKTVKTRIGELHFEGGYPTDKTIEMLYDEMDFQRATQAYIWGIPAVGISEWKNAHDNSIPYKVQRH